MKVVLNWLKPTVWYLLSVEGAARALLVTATMVVAGYTWLSKPKQMGDGTEYFFQTYQFLRHLQLSGSKADLYAFAEWFKPVEKLYFDIEQVPEYPAGCRFTRIGDRYYPHHFGFYSALASVPATVLRVLHLDEHKALNVTNGILFVAMLWGVWLLWPFCRGVGLAYLICLFFSPGTLYLNWPHTEVYICAFVTLSLVSALGGRLKLAILFASLASMQNQTLGVFLVVLGLLFLQKEVGIIFHERRVRWREWALVILAGLPSLLPIVYYLVNIGSPTLLGGMGFARTSFMSLQRAWSVLVDLNQGVVVASAPVVLLGLWFGIRHLCGLKVRSIWILGVTLILCYCVASIANWNSGCDGTMRYATWVYCFMLAFVMANLAVVVGSKLRLGLLIILTVTTIVQFAFLPCDFLKLRKCASFVWTYFPSLYSPEPDVFLSRIGGAEVSTIWSRPEDVWGMFVDKNGRIRKILSTCETLLSKRDVDYCVLDQAAFEKKVRAASVPPVRLQYFNFSNDEITMKVKPFSLANFSCLDESVCAMHGFSSPEPWGIWSTSRRCSFIINLPASQDGCRLVLNASAYVGVKTAAVFANGRELAKWQVTANPMTPVDYEFSVPAELTGRPIRLSFVQRKLVRPTEVDKSSTDTRKLGLGFISLRVVE